jgi:NADH:ubiquinone oxidoreductase subunit K
MANNVTTWLLFSSFVFAIGLYGVLTRRNAIGVLMAIELMLNSAAMNFIVFNRYNTPHAIDGQLMAIFVIAVAAAEAIVAMAIFMTLFQLGKTVDVTQADALRN